MKMDFNPCHWRVLTALFCLAMPLTLLATDVVVADANGNELTYSYDSADGPATFKGVKRYADDKNKAGRIIIADRVTDTNGVSHEVKYVSGSVSNRGNLVSIVFGQNIVATGGPDGSKSDAFSGCNQLESVTLNAKLETLGTYTFLNCYNLASINLGDCKKLTTIKASAIEDCDYVRSITIPASVTTIEKNAFYSIDSLRTVTFATGSQLQNMGGEGTFRECLKLESVNLEACTQLKSIGSYTFRYCTELQTITIGKNVAILGQDCFWYDSLVTDITCFASQPPLIYDATFEKVPDSARLHVPAASVNVYKSAKYWSRFRIDALDEGETIQHNVTVDAGETTANFTWPTDSAAHSYQIDIYKDGEVFCKLTLGNKGQLLAINFSAPGRRMAQQNTSDSSQPYTLSFMVTGLDFASRYNFVLSALDKNGTPLHVYIGDFATTGYTGELKYPDENELIPTPPIIPTNPEAQISTDIGQTEEKQRLNGIILMNGQLFIHRDGKTYTVTGAEVK